MKNYLVGFALIGLIYTAYGCTNQPKTTDETHSNHTEMSEESSEANPKFADAKINNMYQHYIHLKTALVNDDAKEAEMGANMLQKAISDAGITSKYIKDVASAKDVKGKRAKFSELSTELAEVFKKSKIESGVVYKQYCPMANDGNGGYWLASEKKINNPFYGSKMLSCGSVDEEIK